MPLPTLKPRIAATLDTRSVRRVYDSDSWRSGKTKSERGYGYAWSKARLRFLAEHPLCCYCERDGRITSATVVDHIVPHRGDMRLFWDETNWQPLCAHHHSSEKQREENRAG